MTTDKSDARLRKWVQRVPAKATKLAVVWENLDTMQTVAEWERDEAEQLPDAASSIVDAAQDHCNALNAGAQRYETWWCDADGKSLSSRPMRIDPEDEDGSLGPIGGGKLEAGNTAGIIAAFLRRGENEHRMFLAAQGALIKGYRDLNAAQSERIRELEKRVRVAEKVATDQLVGVDAADQAENDEAMDKVLDRLERIGTAWLRSKNPEPAGGTDA